VDFSYKYQNLMLHSTFIAWD